MNTNFFKPLQGFLEHLYVFQTKSQCVSQPVDSKPSHQLQRKEGYCCCCCPSVREAVIHVTRSERQNLSSLRIVSLFRLRTLPDPGLAPQNIFTPLSNNGSKLLDLDVYKLNSSSGVGALSTTIKSPPERILIFCVSIVDPGRPPSSFLYPLPCECPDPGPAGSAPPTVNEMIVTLMGFRSDACRTSYVSENLLMSASYARGRDRTGIATTQGRCEGGGAADGGGRTVGGGGLM